MRSGDLKSGADWIVDSAFEAAERLAVENAALRERIEELKPYEVVSGDTWKARVSCEQLMEQTAQIRLLTHTIDTLNARIKGLQAKIKGYETPAPSADIPICTGTKSSPESEGVSG